MNHICYLKRTLENDTDWTSGERESQSNLLVLTKEKKLVCGNWISLLIAAEQGPSGRCLSPLSTRTDSGFCQFN